MTTPKEEDMSSEKESKSPSPKETMKDDTEGKEATYGVKAAEDKGEGAPVSEQFQKDVYALVKSCSNDEMLDFIQDCVLKKQMESMKKKTQGMETYSDDDMPKE